MTDLDRAESERLISEIVDCLTAAGVLIQRARPALIRFYRGRGWLSMGYASWAECAAARFSNIPGIANSRATLYRQLGAGLIEEQIGVDPGTLPARAVKPLEAVPESDRAAVWQLAESAWRSVKGESGGAPSATFVKATAETVDELRATGGYVTAGAEGEQVSVSDGGAAAVARSILLRDSEAILRRWERLNKGNAPILRQSFLTVSEAAAAVAGLSTTKRVKVIIYVED